MKWKKILSFAIVSVLVMSGLSVISGYTSAQQQGERITEINFGVQLDEEQGALNAADGEIDLFMQSLDGPVWQGLPDNVKASLDTWEVKGSYNNWFLNPAHEGWGTAPMQEAVDNGWIDDNESVRYLANNYDNQWTVNPLAHNDIRFAFQYLDRQALVEDLLLGWGNPRYGPMTSTSELWQQYFVDAVEENYDLSPEGNWNYVMDFVENGMNEIATYIEETHPNMGEVTGNMDDGWYYNHPEQEEHQIEINIMARVEDWRQDKGEWTATRLRQLGFEVNVDPTDSASAIPQAFFGTPDPYDDLSYHIYTGGWISTAAVYYQEIAFSQMHAPWYGFMQTYGDDSHWQYDDEAYGQSIGPSAYVRDRLDFHEHENSTVADMDEVTRGIYAGQGLETSSDYWEAMVDAAQMGFEESVRVFAVTQISLYPYNPDQMLAAVPESINGYDTFFGPRTMRTDDGTLDTEILTGQDRPYMDNWNMEGGSSDVYGEYQRRVAREYGSWTNPQTGIPMQVNNYWMNNTELEERKPARSHPYDINGDVEIGYEYNETGALIENIDIPETAVDWIPSEGEWMNRTELSEAGMLEDNKSAVAVTIDPHLEHTWHDGTEMKFRDILHYYARRKTLADDSTEPFRQATADLLNPFYGTIDAIEWNTDENTYTVYGDYTFPLDDKIGYHYSIYPWDAHPLTYTGWNQLHAGDDYSYDSESGTSWIHQLSTEHSKDMIAALRDMNVPAYLDEANFDESMSSDLAMTESEMDTMVSSFSDFVNETGHSYIGIGPYRIDDYDPDTFDLTITQWDDYGYPQSGETGPNGNTWENGYWSEQFEIDEINIDFLEVSPDEVMLYEQDPQTTVDVTGQVTFEELFPDVSQRALQEGDYNDYYVRLAESERGAAVKTIESQNVTLTDEGDYTSFEAQLDVSDIQTSGVYSVEIWFEDAEGTMSTRARKLDIAVDETYDLTLNVDGEGTTTPADGTTHTYSVLEEVEISADPAVNWTFEQWTGDVPFVEDETSENITVTMDQNRELTAHFSELEEYNLTINAGEGGTTDPAPGTHTYREGDSVTVEAVPDDNWYFQNWTGDYESEDQEITFEITQDMEITAHFTQETPEYELNVTVEGNGSVEIDPDQDIYEHGTEVTLTANPDEGWVLDEWTGDASGNETTIDITMDEDKQITAVFVEETDEEPEDGDGVPGFTVMLLVISAIVAVAIYYNKKERK